MANKKIASRVTDADVEAANQIYKAGQANAEEEITRLKNEMVSVREESEAIGALKKIRCDIAYNETLKYMILYRIKQSKDYKKGGLSWVEFCEAIGEPDRTVDRIIGEMKPVYEKFSADLANLSGYGLNKIRHLGRALRADSAQIEDGVIVFEGEKIPLTPEYKDDIEAILDQLKNGLKEREDEAKAQKKAFERVSTETHKEITKLQKTVDKLEGKAKAKGLTAEEDAFIQKMENMRILLDGYILQVDPERMEVTYDTTTPRMRAALITTLEYAKLQITKMHAYAELNYGDAQMMPEGPGE